MKRSLLLITVAVLAIFSQINISAQSSEEIQFLNAVVSEMQESCRGIKQQTDGVITKATCARSGRDIVMNMYLADKSVNFTQFDAQTKSMFKDTIADSFIQGLLEGDEAELVIAVFQAVGTKFIFNIFDAYNNKLSKTIDFNDLY